MGPENPVFGNVHTAVRVSKRPKKQHLHLFSSNQLHLKMNSRLLRRLVGRMLACLLVPLFAVGLAGCGGGGGGSDDEEVIAPQSLDQVRIAFFGAFTMDFSRLAGVAGQETGAASYTRQQQSFRYAVVNGNTNLGFTIFLPAVLTNVTYSYTRTGKDTGQITMTFFNNQVYPEPEATATNTRVFNSSGDMFWGGRDRIATNLVVDVLFTDQGGFIVNTSTRIRSGYIYASDWDGTQAVNSADPFDFDTVDVSYVLVTGERLPTGYNPYRDLEPNSPSSAVWTTIQGRSIDFIGSDGLRRKIAHQSVAGTGPSIPGASEIEESGTILVDEIVNGTSVLKGVGGTYSYTRTGGNVAKMAIQYQSVVGSVSQTVNLIYTMNFDSLNSGTYVDSAGVSGVFDEELSIPF